MAIKLNFKIPSLESFELTFILHVQQPEVLETHSLLCHVGGEVYSIIVFSSHHD
jgi:hypothetical protein